MSVYPNLLIIVCLKLMQRHKKGAAPVAERCMNESFWIADITARRVASALIRPYILEYQNFFVMCMKMEAEMGARHILHHAGGLFLVRLASVSPYHIPLLRNVRANSGLSPGLLVMG